MVAVEELRLSAEKWKVESTVGSSRHSSMSGRGMELVLSLITPCTFLRTVQSFLKGDVSGCSVLFLLALALAFRELLCFKSE